MAKILYGVHGTGHGHAVRALTIARYFQEHEFLFVSHGTGAAILQREFPVAACPNPETVIAGHKVALAATLLSNLTVRSRSRRFIRQMTELIDRFQPDVAMSDYEFFVPRAARQVGLPCLSIDHQHVIPYCRHSIPWTQFPSYLTTRCAIESLFSESSHFLVISFFRPPVRPGVKAAMLPPLLRNSILTRQPATGDHVVAYQGYATFPGFFRFLKAIASPVAVYGFDTERVEDNLYFKKNSETGFLDDLSSCRYVVCGGSHTLISEALYYGKPVISFPIKNAFEQFLNALYLERLGYGRYFTGFRPAPETIATFESRLEEFRAHISQDNFYGNPEIFATVDRFIRQKTLT